MAKKRISIDNLEIGMFVEADIRESGKSKSGKDGLLLGKGVLITSTCRSGASRMRARTR